MSRAEATGIASPTRADGLIEADGHSAHVRRLEAALERIAASMERRARMDAEAAAAPATDPATDGRAGSGDAALIEALRERLDLLIRRMRAAADEAEA